MAREARPCFTKIRSSSTGTTREIRSSWHSTKTPANSGGRYERQEVTSWATPIVIQHEGKPQVIVSGTNRVRGYDLDNGKVLWECGGLSSNIVASPVSADGMVFAGSSYDKRALLAIRLDGAAGDITGTDQIAWNRFRGTPYVPSPLLYDGDLYFLSHYQGILTRVDARTGEDRPGPFRLDGIDYVYASPVAAAGRIYVTDLDGTTVVVSSGEVPRLLARNRLSEPISASAAIAGRQLFLRGDKHLYCLEDGAEVSVGQPERKERRNRCLREPRPLEQVTGIEVLKY